MKSVLVIGMGRFGRHLAMKMQELGNEVMIVDQNEEIIEELADKFTDAHIGDCTNEAVLHSLGINNFDICFVTIGTNFQSSLEITSLLKENGAQYVISKASRDIQAKFLLRNGADEVVYPEREMAERLALRHNARNILECIELTEEYAIFEIQAMNTWTGKTIGELDIRHKYHINILTVKNKDELKPLPGADYLFKGKEQLLVLGNMKEVFKLMDKAN